MNNYRMLTTVHRGNIMVNELHKTNSKTIQLAKTSSQPLSANDPICTFQKNRTKYI
jgi:hypothetical protein